MTLRKFLDEVDPPDRSLVILNRKAPEPLQRMLEKMFENQPISVEEVDLAREADDQVLVVEDDTVVARSPLSELQDSILMVNSDLFITGSRELDEVTLPAALDELHDVPFFLRGYPESHTEKLLLILVSRYIERTAWEQGAGTLRTSFQSLDRIQDEIGTQQVYRRLDDSPVDVHVYGAPGWEPSPASTITAHIGYEEDFLESWFVVYTPPEGGEGHVALLALEDGPNEWTGFWTYRKSLVKDINDYVEQEL
ncbi:DICT sensory domain-containing protein [Halobellus marinus]|uniref:DICT sensory domain-containing protein n=1 Tax=Halobellus TaxID=1073986 RepID=UPI0028AA8EC7|nr:DICT sensory domain-containing protein [Halobellus sp. DFY28]